MDFKKLFLGSIIIIVLLIILIFYLIFNCNAQIPIISSSINIKNTCGNNICEEGKESSISCNIDCPKCIDIDNCTRNIYNYELQKCETLIIPNCKLDGPRLIEKDVITAIKPFDLLQYNSKTIKIDSIWPDSILVDVTSGNENVIYRIYLGRAIDIYSMKIQLSEIRFVSNSDKTAFIKVS
jgi:hypothetical protein